MTRFILFCCFLLISSSLFAQRGDSIFVSENGRGWAITHTIQAGETVFSVARKYHVPPAMLADANDITFQTSLTPKTKIIVPIGAYNLIKVKPQQKNDNRPIYTVVDEWESLYRIARLTNVQQKQIQQWNGLYDSDISEGQRLLVGWLLYDETSIANPKKTNDKTPETQSAATEKTDAPTMEKPKMKPAKTQELQTKTWVQSWDTFRVAKITDTTKNILPDTSVSPAKALYLSQTYNEESITEEKGPAAFYANNNGLKSGFLYAFHNTAGKGKVIRVKNLNNGRIIYVKVLGPLPNTGLYHNAIIGISSKAKQALGATGERAWCELKYAP